MRRREDLNHDCVSVLMTPLIKQQDTACVRACLGCPEGAAAQAPEEPGAEPTYITVKLFYSLF